MITKNTKSPLDEPLCTNSRRKSPISGIVVLAIINVACAAGISYVNRIFLREVPSPAFLSLFHFTFTSLCCFILASLHAIPPPPPVPYRRLLAPAILHAINIIVANASLAFNEPAVASSIRALTLPLVTIVRGVGAGAWPRGWTAVAVGLCAAGGLTTAAGRFAAAAGADAGVLVALAGVVVCAVYQTRASNTGQKLGIGSAQLTSVQTPIACLAAVLLCIITPPHLRSLSGAGFAALVLSACLAVGINFSATYIIRVDPVLYNISGQMQGLIVLGIMVCGPRTPHWSAVLGGVLSVAGMICTAFGRRWSVQVSQDTGICTPEQVADIDPRWADQYDLDTEACPKRNYGWWALGAASLLFVVPLAVCLVALRKPHSILA